MIKLETSFISGDGGFYQDPLTYKQLKRTHKVALYERSRNGSVKDYEVFIVKVDPKGKKIFDKVLEDDREKYPSSGQFGFLAWSYINLKSAEDRFDKLEREENVPDGEKEKKKELTLPFGEFTVTELAEKNKVLYPIASFFIKTALETQIIKFLREEHRAVRGKASKIYAKA
jgi:hypothetical protein